MSIGFETIPVNVRASEILIEVRQAISAIGAAQFLTQRISMIGQYDPAKTSVVDYVPKKIEDSDHAADLYGFGSMLHLMALKVFKGISTSGVDVFAHPVPDDGSGVAATGDITATGTASSSGVIFVYISGQRIPVVVNKDDTQDDIAISIAAAISAKLNAPTTAVVNGVTTNQVDLTSKWKGLSANDITIKLNLGGDLEANQAPGGVTIAITDMASGALNPDPSDAFTNMGDTWFTRLVYPYDDATNLDILDDAGDVRFQPDVRRFFLGVIGSVKDKTDFITQASSRNSPWETFVPAHLSPNLPFEIAAATVGVTSVRAQADPARPYKGMELPDIIAGYENDQLTYADKNDITEAGGSVTYIDTFGNVRILDLNTTLTLNAIGGEVEQWARRTLAWSNNQAKVFSLESLFLREPFIAAKIVDDDAVTSQQYAISPRKLKSFITGLIDGLWIPQAWSKNRDAIIAGMITEIDALNPERLNAEVPDDHAVGLRILAILYNFTATSNF